MRRTPLMLMTLALVALIVSLASATELRVKAAEFNLDDYAGKVVVVDFWASWCPPCREAMPFLSAMQEKYGEQGLVTVAVNLDQNPSAAKKMIDELQDEIIVVLDTDGAVAQKHKVTGLPTAVVLGRDGAVASTHVGFSKAEVAGREAELKKLLAVGS